MPDIESYIEQYGGKSFEELPFNEVDNLVLAQMSYSDLDGIVPGPGGGDVTVSQACSHYYCSHTEEEVNARTSFTGRAPLLLKKMSASARFGGMILSRYVNDFSREDTRQMAALTCLPGDGTVCCVFRGTDDSITGWKEDFSLSYQAVTAGQQAAALYLKNLFKETQLPVRVLGHSKGGNFAVYAGACAGEYTERILECWSDDGPGFSDDFLQSEGYRRLFPRIRRIIPSGSIIGVLFSMDVQPEIIKSSGKGFLQHDAMTWQTEEDHFVKASGQSIVSLFMDSAVQTWLAGLGSQEKKIFIDGLFSIFESTGEINFTDAMQEDLRSPADFLKVIASMPSAQKMQIIEAVKDTASGDDPVLKNGIIEGGTSILRSNPISGTALDLAQILYRQGKENKQKKLLEKQVKKEEKEKKKEEKAQQKEEKSRLKEEKKRKKQQED